MTVTEIQTSVALGFYLGNSSTATSIITGTLSDLRDHLEINLDIPNSADRNKVVAASLVIGDADETNPSGNRPTKRYTIKKNGLTSIGTSSTVSSNDIVYLNSDGNSFEDNALYSFRIKVAIQENGTVNHYDAKFTLDGVTTLSYEYLHRNDGGDDFNEEGLEIVNAGAIEAGSDIVLNCPMNFVNESDDSVPTHVLFNFDENDNYEGDENDTDNKEGLVSYSVLKEYNPESEYTLENNQLNNDRVYLVTATAIYSDGYSTSTTIRNLHVIPTPVIDSITAYGLGLNQAGAEDPTISSVMNVYMEQQWETVNILPVDGNVRFEFSQDGVLFYYSTLEKSGDGEYTILKDNLTQYEWNAPPAQNEDGSYTFDITMVVNYRKIDSTGTYTYETIPRTSNIVTKTFTHDINQLNNVSIVNAWVAATNVAGEGDRVVDYSDATTAQGYDVAPAFGIVGSFTKNDFFGSGIEAGFFKDLDNTDTNFKFMVQVNDGDFIPVQSLYMMQSDANKSDQQNYIDLLNSEDLLTNVNGAYANIPGEGAGSSQPPIIFWIPHDGELWAQGDGIKVSVAIQPPAGQTTRPDATESNAVALLHKVNRYSMEFGADSEPRFDGSGNNAYLTVPINNEKVASNDLYFSEVILYSTDSNNNIVYSNNADEDGIFDFVIENPVVRGTSEIFGYLVSYKVEDPNGGTIEGPLSTTFSITLKDDPTVNNFTVSNYSYKTFNDDSESSFVFDIEFFDVDDTGIDGAFVYFQREGDSSETTLLKVERSNGYSQTNITVTLTTTAANSSSVSSGIYISDIDGNVSNSMWGNFRSGTIIFKPYYTPKVDSTDDEPVVIQDVYTVPILNIPVIDMPANVSLTGGVIESYNATSMSWDNDLNIYNGLTSIAASYYLEKNETDETENINEGESSYNIDISGSTSSYTMDLSTKISSTVDERVFYSKSVVLVFDSVSVDQSNVTITTKRGSNDINLKTEFVSYTTDPAEASNLNVTAVELIDNPNDSENPYDEDIHVLNCISVEDSVQPSDTINTYRIGDDYNLADVIVQDVRIEAGVDYDLTYGDNGTSSYDSQPLYLTLNGPVTHYVVAKKPVISIVGTNNVVASGSYAGQSAVPLVINASGLKVEGLLSVQFVLLKENNYTNANDESDSTELVLSFESSNERVKSYVVGDAADTTTGSSDNLGANETHVLELNDVIGFSETASSGAFTLVTGNLDENDQSVLYLPSDSEFANSSFNVVAVVSTRVGTDVGFSVVTWD